MALTQLWTLSPGTLMTGTVETHHRVPSEMYSMGLLHGATIITQPSRRALGSGASWSAMERLTLRVIGSLMQPTELSLHSRAAACGICSKFSCTTTHMPLVMESSSLIGTMTRSLTKIIGIGVVVSLVQDMAQLIRIGLRVGITVLAIHLMSLKRWLMMFSSCIRSLQSPRPRHHRQHRHRRLFPLPEEARIRLR